MAEHPILEHIRVLTERETAQMRAEAEAEAKRITEELFFRRGIGGNLELREAVEFERRFANWRPL